MPQGSINFVSSGVSVVTVTSNNEIKLDPSYSKFNELEIFQTELFDGTYRDVSQQIFVVDLTSETGLTTQETGTTLLQNSIPVNQKFIYRIDGYNLDENNNPFVEKSEIGVGYLVAASGSYYLQRDQNYATTGSMFVPNEGFSFILINAHSESLDIKNYFIEPYTVLCSNVTSAPTPIVLEENTLIGRFDGNIQSIDSNELREILTDQNIVQAVEQYINSFSLLCQSLNLVATGARLSAPAIRVLPVYNNSNRPTAQRGTIIYNDQTNRFEGYNGTSWQAIGWLSEIQPTGEPI